MKRIAALVILSSFFTIGKAQRLDKIAERLDKLEKNENFDTTPLNLDLNSKKFILVKNTDKTVYRNILEFSSDNKITLIELMDDKQSDASTSKVYFGDAVKKENYVSVRADKLENKMLDLPYVLNFILHKRNGILYLINVSNNEAWVDTNTISK